jgi:hypothetical protein
MSKRPRGRYSEPMWERQQLKDVGDDRSLWTLFAMERVRRPLIGPVENALRWSTNPAMRIGHPLPSSVAMWVAITPSALAPEIGRVYMK